MAQAQVRRINYACEHTKCYTRQVPEAQVGVDFKPMVIEYDTNGCDDCKRAVTVQLHPLRGALTGSNSGYLVAPARQLD